MITTTLAGSALLLNIDPLSSHCTRTTVVFVPRHREGGMAAPEFWQASKVGPTIHALFSSSFFNTCLCLGCLCFKSFAFVRILKQLLGKRFYYTSILTRRPWTVSSAGWEHTGRKNVREWTFRGRIIRGISEVNWTVRLGKFVSEIVWKEVSGRMFEGINLSERKCPYSMQDYNCLHAAVVICAKPWLTHRQTDRQLMTSYTISSASWIKYHYWKLYRSTWRGKNKHCTSHKLRILPPFPTFIVAANWPPLYECG